MNPNKKKIIIALTNDVVFDQRVAKVANSLFHSGYLVSIVGRRLPDTPKFNRPYKVKLFKLWFNKGPLFYGSYNVCLFMYLLFNKADILLANDLDTLLGAWLANKIKRNKLVFDSHELFTEVPELVHRSFQRKCWLSIQNHMLPKLKNNYTVCKSIASWYKEKYDTDFKVIRNLPLKKEYKNHLKSNEPIFIYQGALNVGRGIDLMIDAMQYVDDGVLWIVGTGDNEHDLKKKASSLIVDGKVRFWGKLLPEELRKLTPQSHIGLSLEENLGLNYYYALPNKLFDYIQARIPVLVSPHPEMQNIIQTYKIGETLNKREPKALAEQLRGMLNARKQDEWLTNLDYAAQELLWEKEEKQLLDIFANLR